MLALVIALGGYLFVCLCVLAPFAIDARATRALDAEQDEINRRSLEQ